MFAAFVSTEIHHCAHLPDTFDVISILSEILWIIRAVASCPAACVLLWSPTRRKRGERWLYMENPYSTELKLLGWDRETQREIERASERSDAVERDPLCTACPIAAECCQLYYSARAAAILSQTHITVSTHIKEQSPTGGKCVTTDDNFTIHSAISLASSDQPLQSFAFALKSTAFVRLS